MRQKLLILGALLGALSIAGGAWLYAQDPQSKPINVQERRRGAFEDSGLRPQNMAQRIPTPAATATTPTINVPSITPGVISVNVPTTITVTVLIADPALTTDSVNLLRLGSTGSQPTVIGLMRDDGRAGDFIAGDHVFTTQVQLNENYPTPILLQVSAAFSGLLRRVTSPSASINVQGLLLPEVLNSSPYIVQGIFTSQVSYSSGLFIFTDLTLNVAREIKGTVPGNILIRTLGGSVGSETQLTPLGTPLAIGQQVVLFLDGPDVDNKYVVSGGTLGIFRLQPKEHRHSIAIVDGGYAAMEMAIPLDPSYLSFLSQSVNSQLSLDALIAAVSTAH